MARRISSSAVVSFFSGEDVEGLGETIFTGSDDDLGMEDEMEQEEDSLTESLENFSG